MTSVLLSNAVVLAAMFSLLWVWSVARKDASVVDPWWSVAFLAVSLNTAARAEVTPAKGVLLATVALWSVRLAAHLGLRARGAPEDPRYQAFRARYGAERYWWVSFFQVFVLQGALAWVISAPLQVAFADAGSVGLTAWDLVGAGVSLVGVLFEAVGDAQLTAFRRDPASRGKVLDTGLWRYTRHPNYFGDALVWWGFGLSAADSPWGLWALGGPALMTFLLARVSGVPMLEAGMKKTRPGYAEYVARTSGFVPWPPKKGG